MDKYVMGVFAKFINLFHRKIDGRQKLINAAVYLVRSRVPGFDDEYFDNTQDFPSGHVISQDEAAYYESLHVLSCLAMGRDLCLVNTKVTQELVDQMVEDWFEINDPLPNMFSVKWHA